MILMDVDKETEKRRKSSCPSQKAIVSQKITAGLLTYGETSLIFSSQIALNDLKKRVRRFNTDSQRRGPSRNRLLFSIQHQPRRSSLLFGEIQNISKIRQAPMIVCHFIRMKKRVNSRKKKFCKHAFNPTFPAL
jgi:hypothetical protein